MNAHNRLPKRLVWVALLFLFSGAGTASAEIEDFVRQMASAPTDGATGALSAGAGLMLLTSVALGILYFWAGYGLLRRQERWRRRAVHLSRLFIGLFGLAALVFLFGEVSATELGSLSGGDQKAGEPLSSPWAFRTVALLALGAASGAYWWALRALQSSSIRGAFPGENKEASSTT